MIKRWRLYERLCERLCEREGERRVAEEVRRMESLPAFQFLIVFSEPMTLSPQP